MPGWHKFHDKPRAAGRYHRLSAQGSEAGPLRRQATWVRRTQYEMKAMMQSPTRVDDAGTLSTMMRRAGVEPRCCSRSIYRASGASAFLLARAA